MRRYPPRLMARQTKGRGAARAGAPVGETLRRLNADYPDAECALEHGSALQLLVATILSAQCTDARVNLVTPKLFDRFPTAESLAASAPGEIEEIIKSTGFFNSKAKAIRGAAKAIVEEHHGAVPRSMAALKKLPGVGRKTANVVLGNVWGTPDGVVVDTHVGRLARRLGWTRQTDPEKVEAELNGLIPSERWVWISHALILHGRRVCAARTPRCESCPLEGLCPKVGVVAKKAAPGRKAAPARGRARKAR